MYGKSSQNLHCHSLGITDITGFIAIDDINKLIVLSYQGSKDVVDFVDDADFKRTPTNLCTGSTSAINIPGVDQCEVHVGFYTSWIDSSDFVLDSLNKALVAYPYYRIISTGHSKGGAVAAIAAVDLRNKGFTVDLVCS